MSTDLRAALREAVAEEPFDSSGLDDVVAAGARRARRRTAAVVGSCALAVLLVAVVTAVVAGSDRSRQDPRPAHVVRLDLDSAPSEHLDVVASVRTTWREPMDDLDHDRFTGLTEDGLVLRSRLTRDGDRFELGLTDPGTGRTDWLPTPPAVADTPVDLAEDRLVLFARSDSYRATVLVFDRGARTWESAGLRLPAGIEVHQDPAAAIGPDGRLYVASNLEGESGPLRWWSYDVREGGAGRPEPGLDGEAVAWGDGVEARAESDGRVVLSADGTTRVVGEHRPQECPTPADPDVADLPARIVLAGDRPVVTYVCGDGNRALTVIHDAGGTDTVQVDGASLLAADEDRLLLAAAGDDLVGGLYLLDLAPLTLSRVGEGLHDEQLGVAAGLVLLNRPGPLDADDVYDVVWQVARLPRTR